MTHMLIRNVTQIQEPHEKVSELWSVCCTTTASHWECVSRVQLIHTSAAGTQEIQPCGIHVPGGINLLWPWRRSTMLQCRLSNTKDCDTSRWCNQWRFDSLTHLHTHTDTLTLDVKRLCSVRGIQLDYKLDYIWYILIKLFLFMSVFRQQRRQTVLTLNLICGRFYESWYSGTTWTMTFPTRFSQFLFFLPFF